MDEFIKALIADGMIIAAAAFVVCQIVKTTLPETFSKYIPLIGGLVGAILGMAIPALFPDSIIIVAAIKGLIIGWAATGAFECVKNLTK